jgi:hypothetical protein
MGPFGVVRRWLSSRPIRPVTPEVAGSSPVAPAKAPANWHNALSVQTPDWSDYTDFFSGRP